MASNRIERIENVSHLVEMEEFWFNDNQIENWDDLKQLEPMKKLVTVYLERNPLYYDSSNPSQICPNYRRKIKLALPQVQQIDATLCK